MKLPHALPDFTSEYSTNGRKRSNKKLKAQLKAEKGRRGVLYVGFQKVRNGSKSLIDALIKVYRRYL